MKKIIILFFLFFSFLKVHAAEEVIGSLTGSITSSSYMPIMWNVGADQKRIIDITSTNIVRYLDGNNLSVIHTGSIYTGVISMKKIIDTTYFDDRIIMIVVGRSVAGDIYYNSSILLVNDNLYIYDDRNFSIPDKPTLLGNRIYFNVNTSTGRGTYVDISTGVLYQNQDGVKNLMKCPDTWVPASYIGETFAFTLYTTTDGLVNQSIMYSQSADKYYLITQTESTSCTSQEIFNSSLIGGELQRLSLDSQFKTNINKLKFYNLFQVEPRQYFLTLCSTAGFSLSGSGGTITSKNVTLIGQYDGSIVTGFVQNSDKFYKNVYNGRWLKMLNNNEIINRGGECTDSNAFSGFNSSGIPTSIYFLRRAGVSTINLYKYTLSSEEQAIIGGDTQTGDSGFLPDTELSDDDVFNKLFDLDRNGDGEIDIVEALLSPITIIQNVLSQLYNAIKNIWEIFKSIIEIGNV